LGWIFKKLDVGIRKSHIKNKLNIMKFFAYKAFSFITFIHLLLVPIFISVYMVVCFVYFCLIL
jgi:hypothetical protein